MENNTAKRILNELIINNKVSRSDLEKNLNVTPSTLSYTIKKIKDFIEIYKIPTFGQGRPKQYLSLNKEYWISLGVKIGRDYVNITKFNGHFEILERYTFKLSKKNIGNENLSKFLNEAFETISEKENIKAVGMAFSGEVVDQKVNSKILKLENFSPEKIVKTHFKNSTLSILNDVEAIATEEYIKYKGENILVINYGTGIGACYYGNDELKNNKIRKIIELGHFYAGGNEKCYCGSTGCLETLASDYAVLKKYKHSDLKIVDFIENEENFENDLNEVRTLYKTFKKKAEDIYEDTFNYLTIFISTIFRILEPKKVILTGEGVTPWFSQMLQKKLINSNKIPIPIIFRGLENNIELGASINALQKYISTKIE
ncbi:ROK family transcriptional regulator [Thermosipho globiformans]|uniref:ROK family transcriptional regulator n=1 Tax=Thermosipho globiformans TaxID=380685 RepID=UPI000F8C643F|nr:ROK family transcriptional regulator [Thermosipho globiformans]